MCSLKVFCSFVCVSLNFDVCWQHYKNSGFNQTKHKNGKPNKFDVSKNDPCISYKLVQVCCATNWTNFLAHVVCCCCFFKFLFCRKKRFSKTKNSKNKTNDQCLTHSKENSDQKITLQHICCILLLICLSRSPTSIANHQSTSQGSVLRAAQSTISLRQLAFWHHISVTHCYLEPARCLDGKIVLIERRACRWVQAYSWRKQASQFHVSDARWAVLASAQICLCFIRRIQMYFNMSVWSTWPLLLKAALLLYDFLFS